MNRYHFRSFLKKGDIIYGTEEGSDRTHLFKVVKSDEKRALIGALHSKRV